MGTRANSMVTITKNVINPNEKKLSQKNTVTINKISISSLNRGSARCTTELDG